MDLSLLSVWEDIKSFLAGNLQLVILVAGAVLAVAAIIIIAACVTAIKRRRAADGRDTAAREGAACDREELPAEEQPGGAEEGSVPVACDASAPDADVQPAVAEAQPDIPQETDVPAAEEPARQEYPVQGKVMFIKPRPGMFIRYRYNRSFAAKLIQSEDKVKRWYSELKRELLSYKKVAARVSWRHESFRYGRPTAAKFVIRGKTLCLCLALDPAAYAESGLVVLQAAFQKILFHNVANGATFAADGQFLLFVQRGVYVLPARKEYAAAYGVCTAQSIRIFGIRQNNRAGARLFKPAEIARYHPDAAAGKVVKRHDAYQRKIHIVPSLKDHYANNNITPSKKIQTQNGRRSHIHYTDILQRQ